MQWRVVPESGLWVLTNEQKILIFFSWCTQIVDVVIFELQIFVTCKWCSLLCGKKTFATNDKCDEDEPKTVLDIFSFFIIELIIIRHNNGRSQVRCAVSMRRSLRRKHKSSRCMWFRILKLLDLESEKKTWSLKIPSQTSLMFINNGSVL